jgi:hypothetical protein
MDVVEGELVEPPVVEASDATSGVSDTSLQVSVDGGGWVDAAPPVVAEAGRTYVFRARAADAAGNWSSWRVGSPVSGVAAPQPEPEPEPEPIVVVEEERPEHKTAELVEARDVVPAALPAPAELIRAPEVPVAVPPVPEVRALDPALRIARIRISRRKVVAEGTAAAGLKTTATVTLKSGRRAKAKRIRVAAGRWRAVFVARRTRRPQRIEIRVPASAGYAAGRHVWRSRVQPLR